MASIQDVVLSDGRSVRVHDVPAPGGDRDAPVVVWHHGSPQTGAPLAPVVAAAQARGFRHVSYGRPSYGGSTPQPGRTVAGAAGDVAQIADALSLPPFAVMGASGGGPHALACAALLGAGRVRCAVCLASPAPDDGGDGWLAGMRSPGGLRAARAGRSARAAFARDDEFDPGDFIERDWAALEDTWTPLGQDAGAAGAAGPDGQIDDDVAFASPWGFDLQAIATPVLVVQGGQDRVIPPAHADRLLAAIPTAELWLLPRDGHVSVLDAIPVALDWIRAARGA